MLNSFEIHWEFNLLSQFCVGGAPFELLLPIGHSKSGKYQQSVLLLLKLRSLLRTAYKKKYYIQNNCNYVFWWRSSGFMENKICPTWELKQVKYWLQAIYFIRQHRKVQIKLNMSYFNTHTQKKMFTTVCVLIFVNVSWC